MFVLKGHNVIIYSCAEYLSINKTLFRVENFHPIMCVHAGSLGSFYFKKKNRSRQSIQTEENIKILRY
jgi:hypothetical protein